MDEKQLRFVREQYYRALEKLRSITEELEGKTRDELLEAIRENSSVREVSDRLRYAHTLTDRALVDYAAEIVYVNQPQ